MKRITVMNLLLAVLLAGLAAAGAPQAQAQHLEEWNLETDNTSPTGIWATETRVYVLDSDDLFLQAYNRSDGTVVATGSGSGALTGMGTSATPQGIWSDGTTLWVADSNSNTAFAYVLSGLARDMGKDISLHSTNTNATGLTGVGTTLYVVDSGTTDRLHAYNRNTKAHLGSCTLDESTAPSGVHVRQVVSTSSTVTTLYVTDTGATTVRAYDTSCSPQTARNISYSDANLGASVGGAGGSTGGEREPLMLFADNTNNRVRVWHLGTNTRFATPFIRLASGGNDKVTEGQVARIAVRFKATDSDTGPDYIPLSDYRPRIGEWRMVLDHAVPSDAITEARPAPSTSCPTDLETTGDFVDPGGSGNSVQNNDDVSYTGSASATTPSATGTFMHVTTCDDRLHEGGGTNFTSESISRGFGMPSNARFGSNFASGITQLIGDNDLGVSLSVPASATEGGAAQITVNLTAMPGDVGGNLVFPVTIDQAAGINFLASSDIGTRSVTVTAATNTASFTINLPEDNLDEDSGSLQFGFGDFTADVDLLDYGIWTDPTPASPNFGEPTGDQFVTAQDNDPEPFVSVANVTVDESEDFMVFTLSLQDSTGTAIASGRNVSLTFTTEGGGTATAGEDYVANTSLAVTVTAGFISQMFSVDIDDDSTGERAETVILAPTGNPVNGQFHSGVTNLNFRPVGTINDDDLPLMEFDLDGGDGVTGTVATEGGAPVFRLSVIAAHTDDIPITVTIAQIGDALVDAATRTETFPAGQTEHRFTLATVNDNTDEEDAKVEVSLSGPNFEGNGATAGSATHVFPDNTLDFTVEDDEDPPLFTVEGGTAPEGFDIVFQIRMRPASGAIDGNVSDYSVTVDYATEARTEDTAMSGDFEALMGTLTFEPSASEAGNEQRLTVAVPRDADDVAETFSLTLSNPMNGGFEGGVTDIAAQGEIQEKPILRLTPGPDADAPAATVSEGEGEAVFSISQTRAIETAGELSVTVVATAGNMLPASHVEAFVLTIPAGDIAMEPGPFSVQFTVAIDDDARDEVDGVLQATIAVAAEQADDYILDIPTATLTVLDDDAPPTVSVLEPASDTEGRPLFFPVRISAVSEKVITVNYSSADGSAVAGQDYGGVNGSLVFDPNQTQHLVEVATFTDLVDDPDETLLLTISAPPPAAVDADPAVTVDTASATGVIRQGLSDVQAKEVNEAILPHVAAIVNDETSSAITDRINTALDGGPGTGLSGDGLSLSGSLPTRLMSYLDNPLHSALGMVDSRPGFDVQDFNFTVTFNGAPGGASNVHSRMGGNGGPPPGALRAPTPPQGGGDYSPTLLQRGAEYHSPLEGESAKQGRSPQLSRWGESAPDSRGSGSTASIWGSGYMRDISFDEMPIAFDGDVTGFMLGVDNRSGDAVFGVAFNHAESSVTWESDLFTGSHETSTQSLHPYFGWEADDGIRLWGSLGIGYGDLELTEDSSVFYKFKRDTEYRSAFVGGYGPLAESASERGSSRVGVVFDTGLAQMDESETDTVEVDSGWVRIGVEWDYARHLSGDGTFGGNFGFALRDDFGDARVGGGMEFTGGLDYQIPGSGLLLDLEARSLLAHEQDLQEWGISGTIAYAPGTGGRGLSIAFTPQWGIINSAHDRLWNGRYDGRVTEVTPAMFYTLEMRYGLPVWRGDDLLTLSARTDFYGAARTHVMGADFIIGRHLSAGIEAILTDGLVLPYTEAPESPQAPQQDTIHRAYLRYERRF